MTFIGGPLNGKTISSDAAKIDLRLVHGIYHRGADGDYTWSGEWSET